MDDDSFVITSCIDECADGTDKNEVETTVGKRGSIAEMPDHEKEISGPSGVAYAHSRRQVELGETPTSSRICHGARLDPNMKTLRFRKSRIYRTNWSRSGHPYSKYYPTGLRTGKYRRSGGLHGVRFPLNFVPHGFPTVDLKKRGRKFHRDVRIATDHLINSERLDPAGPSSSGRKVTLKVDQQMDQKMDQKVDQKVGQKVDQKLDQKLDQEVGQPVPSKSTVASESSSKVDSKVDQNMAPASSKNMNSDSLESVGGDVDTFDVTSEISSRKRTRIVEKRPQVVIIADDSDDDDESSDVRLRRGTCHIQKKRSSSAKLQVMINNGSVVDSEPELAPPVVPPPVVVRPKPGPVNQDTIQNVYGFGFISNFSHFIAMILFANMKS